MTNNFDYSRAGLNKAGERARTVGELWREENGNIGMPKQSNDYNNAYAFVFRINSQLYSKKSADETLCKTSCCAR